MAIKNKSAIFFTLTAIALLSLALVSFSIFSVVKERDSVVKRVQTLNSFVFSIEKDLQRKLFISGFRIIFLFEKRILENGTYISDSETVFNESFFSGTIEGKLQGDEVTLMQGVTFPEIKDDLEKTASKVNLKLSLENPVLSVYHKSPWFVHLRLVTNFSVTDTTNLASWNKTLVTEADVPVEGFEDPFYIVGTGGKIFQKINQTPYTTFVVGNDVSNLEDHLNKSYYIATNLSPSFLNRLEGNFTASDFGIESLVYLPDLAAQGLNIKDKSVVDSIYFGTSNPPTKNVQGMPSWFKIDAAHYETYNVSGLVY